MVLWWPDAFPDQPYNTWFWAKRPGDTGPVDPDTWDNHGYPLVPGPCGAADAFWEWPSGYYWFYKIPPTPVYAILNDNGVFVYYHPEQHATLNDNAVIAYYHPEQLAFKSPDRRCAYVIDYDHAIDRWFVEANTIYIFTYPGQMPACPNTGDVIAIASPCDNWESAIWSVEEVERTQSWGLKAAVQQIRTLNPSVSAVIGQHTALDCSVLSAIAATQDLAPGTLAAISGEAQKTPRIQAAIRSDRVLQPGILSVVAKDFDLLPCALAAISGDNQQHVHLKSAIRADTQKNASIIANVVKSRVDTILLETENTWPQELDIRSTPNHPSKFRDWRKQPIGQ